MLPIKISILFSLLLLTKGYANEREFVVTSLGPYKEMPLFIKQKKEEFVRLNLKDMSYSNSYPFKENSIVLYKEHEKQFSPLKKIIFPEEIIKPLVFFYPYKGDLTYNIFDISTQAFPYGSIQIYNQTGSDLSLKLDNDLKLIKAKKVGMFAAENSSKKPAWLRIQRTKSKKILLSSMIMRRKEKRIFIVALEVPKQGGVREIKFRSLVDFDQGKKQPKAEVKPSVRDTHVSSKTVR